MNETKLLSIKEIKLDKATYPRTHIDWVTRARYLKAMNNGDKFPMVTVAKLGRTYYLVDGAHRLECYRALKTKHTQVEILKGFKNKQEVFIEAVKRNISHGRQFSTQEVTQICITLKDWNLSYKMISEIVRMPAKEISPFVARRMTRITETQTDIALKSQLKNWAGIELSETPNQAGFHGTSQINLLNTVIILLKDDLIDSKDKQVMAKLKSIYKLLVPVFA